ncbi:hypothetical protein DFH06DRAFT_1475119 [Mycena polygramma]|nr:hypothetical protein DFH06DRAFT_1475119 [Mycena polygramma]
MPVAARWLQRAPGLYARCPQVLVLYSRSTPLITLLNYLKSLPRSLLRREASVPLSRDSVCTYVDFSSLWQLFWLFCSGFRPSSTQLIGTAWRRDRTVPLHYPEDRALRAISFRTGKSNPSQLHESRAHESITCPRPSTPESNP